MGPGSVAVTGTGDTRATRGHVGSRKITRSLETSFVGTTTGKLLNLSGSQPHPHL